MKNRLEQIISLKRNNFEIKPPLASGEKPVNVQEAEVSKKYGNPNGMFADYPWDKCVSDMIDRYGDEDTANRICGWIKANYQTEFQEGDDLSGACWEGYEPVGLKEKDGRMVPNCVPVKAAKVVKEGFPVPSPEGAESESEFMNRCMSAIGGEYPQDQAVAICISKWKG